MDARRFGSDRCDEIPQHGHMGRVVVVREVRVGVVEDGDDGVVPCTVGDTGVGAAADPTKNVDLIRRCAESPSRSLKYPRIGESEDRRPVRDTHEVGGLDRSVDFSVTVGW